MDIFLLGCVWCRQVRDEETEIPLQTKMIKAVNNSNRHFITFLMGKRLHGFQSSCERPVHSQTSA